MIDSTWFKRNPHIIVLIVVAALIACVYWLIAAQQYHRVYKDYSVAAARAEARREFQRECLKMPNAQDALKCLENKIDTAREIQRAEENLQAQKDMADWALATVIVAGSVGALTVVLTFVGVIYIRDTLKATRDAVKETEKATKAAEEATNVTRRIGQAQVRAYMSIFRYTIEFAANNSPNISFNYKNSGQSPARNVSFDVRIHYFNHWTNAVITEYMTGDMLGDVPAGSEDTWIPRFPFGGSASSKLELKKSPIQIRTFLNIEYSDVFGRRNRDVYQSIEEAPGLFPGKNEIKLTLKSTTSN